MAISAGKHVYCEWPLGNGLAVSLELPRLPQQHGVLGVIGMQAYVALAVRYLQQLIRDGFVGDVLSTTVAGYGAQGGVIPSRHSSAYLLDDTGGATMLTIPVGHTLAALREVLGEWAQVSSVLATRRKTARIADTGEMLAVTAPDQVLVSGLFASRVPISLHYCGGMPRDGQGLLWEINGTDGEIRICAPYGHIQMVPLALTGAQGEDTMFLRLHIPESCLAGLPADPQTGNVARICALMARDLREGTRSAPGFGDAVAIHRISAAIERSAQTGESADS